LIKGNPDNSKGSNIEPDWTKEDADQKSRGLCAFQDDKLVKESIKCDDGDRAERCCYLTYWDRYSMNKHRRHDVYQNLIKERAHYRYSKIFNQSRIDLFAKRIKAFVFQVCRESDNSNCVWPYEKLGNANKKYFDFDKPDEDDFNKDMWEKGFTGSFEVDKEEEFQNIPGDITLDQGMEFKTIAKCVCPSGGEYPVAAMTPTDGSKSCHPHADMCKGGVVKCDAWPEDWSYEDYPKSRIVTCGNYATTNANIQLKIMEEFNDMDDQHYYDFKVNLAFRQLPHYWKEYDKVLKTVIGRFCLSFTYNPVGACRRVDDQGNATISNEKYCVPWTRKVHSCWHFDVFHHYAKVKTVKEAHNVHDLRIKFIPKFCNLEYKPLEISRVMLKCELQKQLMTTVTTQIWHEKLKYDLQEVWNKNIIREWWVANPDDQTKPW